MEEGLFSKTALITAYIRAYHAAHDTPKIFDDFMAHRLVTAEEWRSLGLDVPESIPEAEDPAVCRGRPAALTWWIKVIAGSIIARARYIEDALDQAVRQKKIEQYVILGAGLDTFALRRPEMLERLRVFEIDHPATQVFKRRRLAEANIELPGNLRFIPLDFAAESLSEALKGSHYDPGTPAFFSWPGVTFYLKRKDVMAVFGDVADLAQKGSRIVFDYLDEGFFAPDNPHYSVQLVLENVRLAGEPMLTGFAPPKLAAELAQLGLIIREDLCAAQVETNFLMGQTRGYHAGLYTHFAQAEVE